MDGFATYTPNDFQSYPDSMTPAEIEETNKNVTKIASGFFGGFFGFMKTYAIISAISGLVYLVLMFFAIYLSFKCNGGFDLFGFLGAFFCPVFYLIYKFATTGLCNHVISTVSNASNA